MIQKSITIDLWRKYRESIEFNQHEVKGRTLNITLTSGGSPVNLTGAAVTFNMNKGAEVIYNACVITSAAQGKVSLKIEGAVCDTAGVFESFIEIVKTDDVLRTHSFSVTVKASADNTEAVEAQSSFTALTEALALVSGHEERIETAEDKIDALESERTGWRPLNEAWTYSSSTVVNVPSGALSRHQIGDIIMISQHGAVKCFDCIGVTNTTLTLVPRNGTHSIENTASYPITDIYYSHGAFPFGCPASGSIRAIDSGSIGVTTTGTAVTFATGRFSKLPNMMFGERYISASGAATAVPVSVKYEGLTKSGVTLIIPSGGEISTYWTAIELYP